MHSVDFFPTELKEVDPARYFRVGWEAGLSRRFDDEAVSLYEDNPDFRRGYYDALGVSTRECARILEDRKRCRT